MNSRRTTFIFLAVGVVIGIICTLTVTGCSEAARRTLEISQSLGDSTYDGHFRIDTSEIPQEAVIEQTEHKRKPGLPETHISLNPKYEFEIVIRLLKTKDE